MFNPLKTSVRESAKAGALLLSVSATDDDCRHEPCVTYSLEPADLGFEINSQNGMANYYLCNASEYVMWPTGCGVDNRKRPYEHQR